MKQVGQDLRQKADSAAKYFVQEHVSPISSKPKVGNCNLKT